MFCVNCGNKLNDGDKFCTSCGTKLVSENVEGSKSSIVEKENRKKEPDTEVKLNIQPKFKFLYLFFPSMIMLILGAAFVAFAMGTILRTNVAAVVAIAVLGVIALYIIFALITKLQYDNYSYDFYREKIVYKDGFINKSEKEIKYKNIREVVMSQSFFQRIFNLGTIMLYTSADSGFGNGIRIVNVENVKELYSKIKEIVD